MVVSNMVRGLDRDTCSVHVESSVYAVSALIFV